MATRPLSRAGSGQGESAHFDEFKLPRVKGRLIAILSICSVWIPLDDPEGLLP
jgi:hypothetical protein